MSVNPRAEHEWDCENRRNPIWPDLKIFHHPATRQLFGYAEMEVETPDE